MHYQINRTLTGYIIEFYLQGELVATLTVATSEAEKNIKTIMLEQHFGQRKSGLLFYFEEKLIQSKNPDMVTFWLDQVKEDL
jgi:hypothetical protein